MRISSQLLLLSLVTACAHGGASVGDVTIVDKPVPFTEQRIQLTREYIKQHYGVNAKNIEIVPRIIVLHWTAGRSFAGDFNTFTPATLQGSRPDLAKTSELNVAIQFLVDRDGTIYRLMPETWMARHVIGLNYNAIGVENVGGSKDLPDLTPAQLQANIKLVRYLARKYRTIEYLIGHMEYRGFEGHPLWLERDTAYRTEKSDPGPAFMTGVRDGVRDLRLKGVPLKH
ncbi:MAG TPA: peptidoglycan recognition family protein [Longimicrobiales bacterium]|nr:peptidoglycan recognition family protein [Longimicrobiales bacterium]